MQFVATEWHQVSLAKTYEVDDDEAIELFGSVERLKEIVSWQEQETFGGMEPMGDEPTDEEQEAFDELFFQGDYIDSEEDWWTDRKGGYDITFKVVEED